MLSTTPTYNLKIVLKETGLPADTLRAWERRYGLPAPQRTAGGQRLYSQYDVELIKWLLVRQSEGLTISRAVEMWNNHSAAGVDLLADSLPTTQTLPAVYVPSGITLASIRAEWMSACMDYRESDAERILNKAFTIFPLELVCTQVLQTGMSEIGQLWYENKATVQQEHFASGLAMRRLDSLMSASPAPSHKKNILVGCPANEWHTFTPLLLTLLLRRRGWNVLYLGANVPSNQFEETVQTTQSALVILVAQTLITAATLHETAVALARQQSQVAFGGRIFNLQPQIRALIPGHFLGSFLPTAVEESEKVLKSRSKENTSEKIPAKYLNALQSFKFRRTQIESTLKESLPPFVMKSEGFHTGLQFLGDNILAALQLGDMEYVTQEMEWVRILMQTQKRPAQELDFFIKSYSQAVDKHINGQGSPIKNWLNTQITI